MIGTSTVPTGTHALRVEPGADVLRHLPDPDYTDAFRLTDAPPARARHWAQRCLDGGPSWRTRIFGILVWHSVLGFDLAEYGAPGTLAGWHVAVDEPDLFVLTVGGSLLDGCMVFHVDGTTVTWTTALRYVRPHGKIIWSGAQRVHRALAGRLLAAAARRR